MFVSLLIEGEYYTQVERIYIETDYHVLTITVVLQYQMV